MYMVLSDRKIDNRIIHLLALGSSATLSVAPVNVNEATLEKEAQKVARKKDPSKTQVQVLTSLHGGRRNSSVSLVHLGE